MKTANSQCVYTSSTRAQNDKQINEVGALVFNSSDAETSSVIHDLKIVSKFWILYVTAWGYSIWTVAEHLRHRPLLSKSLRVRGMDVSGFIVW